MSGSDNVAVSIDDIARQSLLYDYYGQLLTPRQQTVYELYTQENLSLSEVAEELEISRQGVHDALRSARRSLEGYEDKLGLVSRFLRTEKAVGEIDEQIGTMIELLRDGAPAPEELIRQLEKIRSIIDGLEE